MKLIIGLGNPGKEYTKTRHNVGFMVIDSLAKNLGADFKLNKKFQAEIAVIKNGKEEIVLVKPQTFMNLSGISTRSILNFYKIKPEDIAVIHDDKDILFGQVKYQTNKSDAGHNGIKSIIEHLNTQDFSRIRVGVALEDNKKMGDTANFVLMNFTKTELELLDGIIKEIVEKLVQN
ncbi:MAG: aminoacyl-tRNA hydrolase [Candidatus Magasanikbacteria bacterium]|nr:aminoacyl-tRNA hydrolase [Candidatus Magasanikbacteria bacterium]